MLNPKDIGAEWIDRGTYLNYYAIGQLFKPTSIAEIGTRYGYSLHAMYAGSLNVKRIYSFDSGYDFKDSCDYIKEKFGSRKGLSLTVVNRDTQDISSMSYWIEKDVDLFHVDGNHTSKGVFHDCMTAWRHIKQGGILLIDDVSTGDMVRIGADKFLRMACVRAALLPCYRGMYIVQKPEAK